MLRNVNYSTSQPFLIRAGWLYTACSPAIRRGALLIKGNTIEAVLTEAAADAEAARLQSTFSPGTGSTPAVVDLGEAVVTPGLFNLHTHLDYTEAPAIAPGLPIFDWMAALVASTRSWSPDDFRRSALTGADLAAKSGTTFVVDSSYSGMAAEALASTGLKGIVGLELFGLDEERSELIFSFWQKRYEQWHDTASSALKNAIENKRIVTTIAPHAAYTVSPKLWQMASRWAAERGVMLTAHLAESQEEVDWLGQSSQTIDAYLRQVMPPNPAKTLDQLFTELTWKGQNLSPCAHLDKYGLLDSNLIAAHSIYISDDDIQLLKNSKARLALCRRSNARLLLHEPRVRALRDAGVDFGLGTDSLASNCDLSPLKEAANWYERGQNHDGSNGCITHPAEQNSFSADECLRLITANAAIAANMPRCGTLAPGQSADLASFLLSGNKELSAANLAECLLAETPDARSLMVDGRFIMHESELL